MIKYEIKCSDNPRHTLETYIDIAALTDEQLDEISDGAGTVDLEPWQVEENWQCDGLDGLALTMQERDWMQGSLENIKQQIVAKAEADGFLTVPVDDIETVCARCGSDQDHDCDDD